MSRPCVAPLTLPPLIPNATLISLFLYIRHGARTPFVFQYPLPRGVWHCGRAVVTPPHRIPVINGNAISLATDPSEYHEFPPDCSGADLLDEGFRQLEALGSTYRSYLTERTALLPRNYNQSLISVRSTYTARTIASVVGFMHGLYPPQKDGDHLLIQTFSFWSIDEGRRLVKDPVFQSRLADSKRILKPLIELFHWHHMNPVDLLRSVDCFMPYRCSNNTYHKMVTDELYERMMDDFEFLTTIERTTFAKEEFTPIWKEIDQRFKELAEGKSQVRFTVTAAHDTDLHSILAGLGNVKFIGRPPYASHIAIEIWDMGQITLFWESMEDGIR